MNVRWIRLCEQASFKSASILLSWKTTSFNLLKTHHLLLGKLTRTALALGLGPITVPGVRPLDQICDISSHHNKWRCWYMSPSGHPDLIPTSCVHLRNLPGWKSSPGCSTPDFFNLILGYFLLSICLLHLKHSEVFSFQVGPYGNPVTSFLANQQLFSFSLLSHIFCRSQHPQPRIASPRHILWEKSWNDR